MNPLHEDFNYERGRATDEKIVVDAPSGSYEISRYCPHAGEDLAIGSIVVDGMIRCLGHNLEFDLATGTCLNARCDPLITRSLVRVPSEAIDSPEMEGF